MTAYYLIPRSGFSIDSEDKSSNTLNLNSGRVIPRPWNFNNRVCDGRPTDKVQLLLHNLKNLVREVELARVIDGLKNKSVGVTVDTDLLGFVSKMEVLQTLVNAATFSKGVDDLVVSGNNRGNTKSRHFLKVFHSLGEVTSKNLTINKRSESANVGSDLFDSHQLEKIISSLWISRLGQTVYEGSQSRRVEDLIPFLFISFKEPQCECWVNLFSIG